MAKIVKAIIQFRRAYLSDWEAVNPVLRIGEPSFVLDTNQVKIGDGVTHWLDLPYQGSGSSSVFNAQTHYDFPSVGEPNVIYKAESESALYQWNPTELKYEILMGGGLTEIEVINGGDAYYGNT